MGVKTQSDGNSWRSKEHVEQLLPGLPNEITLNEITWRLPWTAFHILSSVSRCWRGAIQSHEVYNARVHAQSTETLVVHFHHHGEIDAVALYSPRDDCCYELPALPHLGKKTLSTCECISLDGKIYVMGGLKERRRDGIELAEVYVFDVAGQRPWGQCASMQERRHHFGCGIIHGKIYVSGGVCDSEPLCGSEVYDPDVNAWSPIMPMTLGRMYHRVTTLGDEFFAYGGVDSSVREHAIRVGSLRTAHSYEVYNAVKNEWRLVELAGGTKMFMANGKFYSLRLAGRYIDVFDADNMSWTNLHTISYADTGLSGVVPFATLVIKDELFIYAVFGDPLNQGIEECFLRSKGFNGENNRLVWQKINSSRCFLDSLESFQPPLKCLIQL